MYHGSGSGCSSLRRKKTQKGTKKYFPTRRPESGYVQRHVIKNS